jgi:hypothetical protein
MTAIFEHLKFPDSQNFKRMAIVPVYVEPLAFSGERLFVGVVVSSVEGVQAFPLENLKRLHCVYGPAYRSILVARDAALASLVSWLNESGLESLTSWIAPGDGIYAGRILHTSSSTVTEAVRASFSEWSSLYEDPSISIDAEPRASEERLASFTASRLESLVRDVVKKAKPELDKKFGLRYRINDNARPMRLGFVGEKLVANFGLIVPQALSSMVSISKARLWDLASAREGAATGWFSDVNAQSYDLFVHHATVNDVQYSARQLALVKEALAELEAEADRLKLRCRPIVGPQAIAEHLLTVEA